MKILVTGATSGLGYSLCCSLSKRGHIVYVASKTKKESAYLKLKAKEQKVILFPIVLNLLRKEDFRQIEELDLDGLVLQAGVGEGGSLSQIDVEKLRDNYEVNVFSNLSLIQVYLRDREARGKRGKLFVTSSLLSHLPCPYLGSYGSSKASLSYLMKTLSLELFLEGKDVSVTLIEPGAYHTGFNQVMLANKERNQKIETPLDKKIGKMEEALFVLLESFSYFSFVETVRKEIESHHPRKRIAIPKRQSFWVQLYRIFSPFFD